MILLRPGGLPGSAASLTTYTLVLQYAFSGMPGPRGGGNQRLPELVVQLPIMVAGQSFSHPGREYPSASAGVRGCARRSSLS